MTSPLHNNFFRHEYSRLVAILTCRNGVEFVEDIEDAVQSALVAALETWTHSGHPDNPSAWLFRVANNNFLGNLRQQTRRQQLLKDNVVPGTMLESVMDVGSPDEINDSLLKMLFTCCDESIPIESQLVFALKVLCGFDTHEIAVRLFTTDANVYKRLSRARDCLRSPSTKERFAEEVNVHQYATRLPAVHKVLYLVFTEGYLSSNATTAIRRELCDEAIRLTSTLAEHTMDRTPETFALLALMYLHSARLTARQNETVGLLLLEEQDRDLWDQTTIAEGLNWLARSADGSDFSRYHAEAGIAAEHCISPSFADTNWEKVVDCYNLLERATESPYHKMNKAMAIAEWKGPEAGLKELTNSVPPPWLAKSYLWCAVMSDLNRRCGNSDDAIRYGKVARQEAPTDAVRTLLTRRLKLSSLEPQ